MTFLTKRFLPLGKLTKKIKTKMVNMATPSNNLEKPVNRLQFDYELLNSENFSNPNSYLNTNEEWREIKKYFLENILKNVKILELGSGGGFFGNWLVQSGYKEVVVSDLSKVALKKITESFPKLKRVQLDARDFKTNKKFDVVVSLDLMEHISDVEKHIRYVRRALKRRGIYIIKTPNKLWEIAFYKYWLYRNNKKGIRFWEKAHVSIMFKNELRNRLLRAGFLKVDFLRQSALTRAQEKKVKNSFGNKISQLLIAGINSLLRILPLSLGIQFIVIAYKH